MVNGAGEATKSARHLPHKQEGLSLVPGTLVRSQVRKQQPAALAAEENIGGVVQTLSGFNNKTSRSDMG